MFLELFRWLQWHWHSYNSAETAQFTCWHREWNLLFIFLLELNHIRSCSDVLTKNSTITYLIAFFAFVLLENKFYWISKYAAVKSLEYNQCFFLTNTYLHRNSIHKNFLHSETLTVQIHTICSHDSRCLGKYFPLCTHQVVEMNRKADSVKYQLTSFYSLVSFDGLFTQLFIHLMFYDLW